MILHSNMLAVCTMVESTCKVLLIERIILSHEYYFGHDG